MEIELINMKKFIVANGLREVTNPITFEKGATPTKDGVLSTDIFGVSMQERKRTYAYVSLNGHFLHPLVYKVLKRLNRKFEDCIIGTKTFKITEQGELVEDENGNNGLEWLYKNWNKLNFERNNSSARNSRIDLVTFYDRDTLFCQQWVVIPPFYRDVNLSQGSDGKASHHEVNDKYSKLIRLSSNLTAGGFSIILNQTYSAIQNVLVEIYDIFKKNLERKNGLQRKALLGKSVDYGARLVISAPRFVANSPDGMNVSFYRTGLPLSMVSAIFTPFIVSYVRRFFERELSMKPTYPVIIDGKETQVELDDPASHFNEDYIMKKLQRFIKSPADRYEVVYLPTKDKKYENKFVMSFRGRLYEEGRPETEATISNRPLTWTDVFYQACYNEVEKSKKMIWITRYPLLDYFGMLTTYVHVHSTMKTKPVMIDSNIYPYYPDIDMRASTQEISTNFIDTATMSNLYLAGLGADYDGDQISVRGVFTQEAQKQSEEIMYSKANVLNIYGGTARTTTNEGIQTVYMMTKHK